MATLATIGIAVKKSVRSFFIAQTIAGVWVRLLCFLVVIDTVGIVLSLAFFLQVKDMNQVIISSIEMPKTEDVDRSGVHTTLEAFSRRVVEFEYREVNGVSIPEPR